MLGAMLVACLEQCLSNAIHSHITSKGFLDNTNDTGRLYYDDSKGDSNAA